MLIILCDVIYTYHMYRTYIYGFVAMYLLRVLAARALRVIRNKRDTKDSSE